MRKVFKTYLVANIGRLHVLFDKVVVGQLQAFLGQPPLGSHVESPFKVTFEGSEASSGQVAKSFHGHIEHEMLVLRDFV